MGHEPLNLAQGPLMGATLLRLDEEEHVLLLTVHRIVFDGWSLGVLLRELTTLYEAFSTGQLSPLPELPIQYGDFAVWQREMLQGERLAECLAYWKQQLAGMPEGLDLPTDRPHLPVPTSRSSTYRLTLPKWLSDALKELSRKEGANLYMTLVAAFQTLLYRYSGQDDLVIGTVAAGRTQAETEGLIGFFVNTLALRTDLSGNPTFSELLGRVREALLEAQAHQDLPFESLVKELHPTRLSGQNPLFQVMLSFEAPLPTLPPAWTLAQLEVETGTTQFDLSLELDDRSEGLISRFVYSTDLFDEATIARIAGHWQTLLEGIAADPAQRIAALPLLTQAERHQLLAEWNATDAEYPQDQCIHQLFESQVERTPEAVAVVFENEQLNYRELNRRANQLAHYLCDLGVGPDVLVGICVERSLDMVVGLLGILKAGGAYVPLDPAFPSERLAFMLEDAQAPVLVTQHHLLTTLPAHGAKVICLDADAAVLAQQSEADPSFGATSDHLAYVIYTSGSTGRPKGVQIVHRAVVNFLLSMREQPGLMAEDTLLAITTLSFDIAALELFLPLIVGARVIVASRDTAADGAALAETLTRSRVTVMQATPITWRLLLASGWQGKPDLKILCGGEALPLELAEQLLPRAASLWNLYGPTETTIWSTICKIEPGEEVMTIGRPIANTQIYLLDPQFQPVPVGVPGELYIGGGGLARGYLHRPELTAERFLPHPFSDEPGARLYKTGDLSRYRPDGTIEHLGRLDFQVKLRGFRIELGEIETVLAQHPAVRQAVVVAREDVPGDKRLVAYVVLCEQQMAKAGDLQRHAINQLPHYMVPSAVVLLEAFPLTPNGKVDRRALPVPDHSHPERAGSFVAPRTPLEEMVAASWSQVLDIGQVGIHDNFFELGGHSLLAMQVIAHLRITLQVELSLRSFFEAPTVAQLAERIGQMQADTMAPSLLPTIEAVSRKPYRRHVSLEAVGKVEEGVDEVIVMPISLVQQGLWLVDQLESDSPTYNLPITLRLRKRLDMSALEQSLQILVQRHEALRTTVALIDEQPMQVIAPRMRVAVAAVDLREVPHEQQEVELQRLVSHEVQQPFDLALGPLIRAMVLHLGAEEHLVLLIMHHIISDGWSVGVIGQELTQLYDAYVTGRPAQLAELPLQYADFALWQREWLQEERLDEQLSYWRETLAGAPPVLELPTDHPRPALPTHRGAEYTFTLAEALNEGLKQLSRQEGVTLYMTLVAGFVALLQRYTEQDDVVIGTTTAGRSQQEIKDVIGYFVNTLVLRIDMGGNPSVREVLARVREGVLGAHAHQETPFERLVKELQPERSLSQNPIFQVLLTLDPPLPKLASEWEFVRVSTRTVANKFDLALSLSDRDERLAGCLEYSTDLFEDATIVRMMKHWQMLLEAMVADPGQPIAQLPLLSERERQQLLVEWNATQQSAPDKCYPQMFEEQVLRTPDAIALVFEHQQMTYGELNARANQLAHHLQQLGVGPEVMVGLCVERSPEMIVGLLGILKAGGVYVPLDPEYPQERLAFLLQDSIQNL
ncbi:MAG TPA: amino acid adenylation domain-containing protein [Ktedonobacteraceae bacterium]